MGEIDGSSLAHGRSVLLSNILYYKLLSHITPQARACGVFSGLSALLLIGFAGGF
jgi:hypothetical protein